MAQNNNFEGKRIKGDKDAAVYLVMDNKLRHIINVEIYEALFGTNTITFDTVPQPMVDAFTKGHAMDQRTPLVKGFGAPVYLIDEGEKRWIKSADAFNRYGFSWDKITSIGSVVDLVASGPNIE
jgi:hypothetical protein